MDPVPVRPPQDAMTVRRLRLGIGVVGIALPIVLTAGNALLTGRVTLLDSISGFYHTGMRDVFVGGMCAIGVFLICYRYRRLDDALSTVAGVLAVAVALFPTATDAPAGTLTADDVIIGRVHQIAAAALFVLLAVFCLFRFPASEPSGAARGRRVRNGIYYACGGLILSAITLAVASNALPEATRDTLKPLFWCEAVAVLAFGAAWLVKGEELFRAARPAPPAGPPARAARPVPG
ncbi:DUF998 domain-containing protein [Micromonospora deserti]|uniref:DUF998 domain-containing protein n=1 Tax=Micromonospora deserti TaxID=2070366 RepID=A0A2W2CXT2_9ACTN|nr:DUF998 domain-containing protein [Micromonospora deserti]PZG02691.1 DUF998 domain-containing protein [Micromonospora deserti]